MRNDRPMASTGTGARRVPFVLLFATLIAVSLLLLEFPLTGPGGLVQAAGVATASLVLGWYALARVSPLGAWSTSWWFLAVLSLFHLGLAAPLAFGIELAPETEAYARAWFGPERPRVTAVLLSGLAIQALVLGALVGGQPSRRTATDAKEHELTSQRQELPGAGLVGLLLVGGGCAMIFQFIYSINPLLLLGVGGRNEFWDSLAGQGVIDISAFAIAFGGILLIMAPPRRAARNLGLLLLAVFLLWALVVGARSLSMYTVATLVMVVARRHRMPSARVALAFILLGLSTVSVVSTVRGAGVTEVRASDVSVNPVRGIAEMGGSLRPLVVNVELDQYGSESPRHGLTYVGFALRQGESLLALPRPAGESDPRLAGTELRKHGFPQLEIGYSAVAEAFLNWRIPGVIAVFLLQGWVLGRFDTRWRGDIRADYLAGTTFFLFSFTVRQPSTMVLPLLMMSLCAYAMAASFSPRTSRYGGRVE